MSTDTPLKITAHEPPRIHTLAHQPFVHRILGARRSPRPALLGCWRADTIVLHTADGAKLEDRSGRCTLQFKEEQLESTCRTTQGLATTTYRYQVVRPQVYATTLAASTVRTEMASATREYAYRIEGEQLHTETAPPTVAPAASAATARTEADATKVACP